MRALRIPPGRREREGEEMVLRWIVAEMVVRPSLSAYSDSEGTLRFGRLTQIGGTLRLSLRDDLTRVVRG